MRIMKSKRPAKPDLHIKFRISGTISEKPDDRTFHLGPEFQPAEKFGFDITFDNSNRSMINHPHDRLPSGINRASKLNDELLAILYKEECE